MKKQKKKELWSGPCFGIMASEWNDAVLLGEEKEC